MGKGSESWLIKSLSKEMPKWKNKSRTSNEETKFLELEARKGGIKEKPSENHKAELVANMQVVPFSDSSRGSLVL